ncbi:MAG: U32 family peptidase C-terminal domain-containing protein [Bdellovibrionales bacterium]|nr:U32 family peptidase C-terminal domain-containing protein [Bdellovibrionales bacterium]
MKNQSRPELLMPAGSLEKLEYAFAYGADAAYLGVPFFSLRARENEFDLEALFKARQIADQNNKKIYVTANVFAKNRKLSSFLPQLRSWLEAKPDALIMGDPGLMMLAREQHPDLEIHLSVQANAMNWQSVKFWHKSLNVKRIILSRELHLDEVREIKQRVPEVEIEAFVHGSICIAYSGRCLLSSYMSYRDANQGVCDNSCREKFNVYSAKDVSKEDDNIYVEDLRAQGSLYRINEDENGTFIMNAKDLRLIEHLNEIHEAGVCSFKVEGRTKSVNYVSLVARAYKNAIDDMMRGQAFDQSLLGDLDKVANRGYDTGFMMSKLPGHKSQNYETSVARHFTRKFGGVITRFDNTPAGYLSIDVRNKLSVGKECELITPEKEPIRFTINKILNLKNESVEIANGGTGIYFLAGDFDKNPSHGILSIEP